MVGINTLAELQENETYQLLRAALPSNTVKENIIWMVNYAAEHDDNRKQFVDNQGFAANLTYEKIDHLVNPDALTGEGRIEWKDFAKCISQELDFAYIPDGVKGHAFDVYEALWENMCAGDSNDQDNIQQNQSFASVLGRAALFCVTLLVDIFLRMFPAADMGLPPQESNVGQNTSSIELKSNNAEEFNVNKGDATDINNSDCESKISFQSQ